MLIFLYLIFLNKSYEKKSSSVSVRVGHYRGSVREMKKKVYERCIDLADSTNSARPGYIELVFFFLISFIPSSVCLLSLSRSFAPSLSVRRLYFPNSPGLSWSITLGTSLAVFSSIPFDFESSPRRSTALSPAYRHQTTLAHQTRRICWTVNRDIIVAGIEPFRLKNFFYFKLTPLAYSFSYRAKNALFSVLIKKGR